SVVPRCNIFLDPPAPESQGTEYTRKICPRCNQSDGFWRLGSVESTRNAARTARVVAAMQDCQVSPALSMQVNFAWTGSMENAGVTSYGLSSRVVPRSEVLESCALLHYRRDNLQRCGTDRLHFL